MSAPAAVQYEIISTGSKGNAAVVGGEILIDCGVPWKSLEGRMKGIKLALLTHAHGDHFRAPTARRLAAERPALRWGMPPWMAAKAVEAGIDRRRIDVCAMGARADYGRFSVRALPLSHDAPNCGWRLDFASGGSAFYATDTGSLDGIEARGLALYLVEANYGEKEIAERIRAKQDVGEHCHEWRALKNHLSREKALDWLYKNMGPGSEYALLHGHGR